MTVITTQEVVEGWLRTNGVGSLPDGVVDQAHEAAEAYVAERCQWDETKPSPADLVLAVCIQTARYLARRNSPTGLVGIDDLGVGQIPGNDADVLRLMAPHRTVVFG